MPAGRESSKVDTYALLSNGEWNAVVRAMDGNLATRISNNAARYRRFVDAAIWIAVNDAAWKRLPRFYGGWRANYVRFSRWSEAGYWQRVAEALGLADPKAKRLLARCEEQRTRRRRLKPEDAPA